MVVVGQLLDQAWTSMVIFFQTGGVTGTEVLSIALIFVVGVIGGRIISEVIKRLLKMTSLDDVAVKSNIQQMIRKLGYSGTLSDLIGDFIKLFIYLLVLFAIFNLLGMQFFIEKVQVIFSVLPRVLLALLTITAGFMLSSYIESIIVKVFRAGPLTHNIDKTEAKTPAYKILGGFIKWVGYTVSVLIALSILGVNTLVMTMLIGILSLGLVAVFIVSGKDLMKNFALSIHLQISDELQAGDRVEIDGKEGKITKMTALYTKIKDGRDEYYVPNEKLLENLIGHRREKG